jgi:carbon storage regulator
MLILARRRGERIRIGPDIEVVVTSVGRGQVKLGVVAPAGVRVLRNEVYLELVEENRRATRPALERLPAVDRAIR